MLLIILENTHEKRSLCPSITPPHVAVTDRRFFNVGVYIVKGVPSISTVDILSTSLNGDDMTCL